MRSVKRGPSLLLMDLMHHCWGEESCDRVEERTQRRKHKWQTLRTEQS